MKTRHLIIFLSALIFVSCGNKPKQETAEPQNLPAYFQTLIDSGKTIPDFIEDTARVAAVVRSFAPLQEYAEGKRLDYPAEEVQRAIGAMLENFAYEDNMEMCVEDRSSFEFFDRYLEQVCRLCPDAKLLCSGVSEDGKVGYFDIYTFPVTYKPYSGRSIYPYIIYKTEQGFCPALMDFFNPSVDLDRVDFNKRY